VLFAAAEIWATQLLLTELGVTDPITSWLWATGQVAAMIWFLETLARKTKSRLAFVAGYALVVVVFVAMAVLRTGDLGTDETDLISQTSQTLILCAVVCGIPFLLSAALGAYNERSPLARKLRNETRKLQTLEERQAVGQRTIEESWAAVEDWKALERQVRAEALVPYPTYFHDAPPPYLPAPSMAGETLEDTHDATT